VTAVDVGVGQQNNLVVANLGDVEIGFDAGTDRRDQSLNLGVLQNFVRPCLFDVQDLASNRQDRWMRGLRASFATLRPSCPRR